MAATLEATFRLNNRASASLREIRVEAERTQKALLSAGASTDAIGGARAQKNFGSAERAAASVRHEVDRGSASMNIFSSRWVKMTGLILAALPALTRAGGVLTQLVGSLAQAVGGAGVIGGGAIGLAVVGFGSLLSVLKPMETQLKTSKTAFDAYNKAVDMYGVKSKQAATQAKALNEALKNAPKGTLGLLTTVRELGKEWTKETRPAQNSLMGMLLYGAQGLRANSSTLSGIVNGNVKSLAGGGKTIIDRLLDPSTLRDLKSISTVFQGMVPDLANIGGDAITSFFRLVKDAAPYVASITKDVSAWADRFDRSTQDTAAMDERFKRWTASFREWVGFLGSTKDLLSALLGSASGGNKELEGITAHFREWAQWIRTNPVRMNRFWQDSLKFGQGFGNLLVYIGKLIFGLSDALTPAEAAIGSMLQQLGPEFLQTLKQVSQLMQSIFGGVGGLGGPLTIFLKVLTTTLSGINDLIKLIPGLGPLIAAAFTVRSIMALAGWVSTTTSRMIGLAAATNDVAAAQARLGGAGLAAGGGALLGGAGGRAAAAGLSEAELIGGAAALGGGKFFGSVTRPSMRSAFGPVEGATMETSMFPMETAAMGFGLSGGAVAASRFARLGTGARALGRVAGKFALPVTAALGAMDAYSTRRSGSTGQQIAQTTAGVLHGLTFGLTPTIATPGMAQDAAIKAIMQGGSAQHVGGHEATHWNFNPLSSKPIYGVGLSGGRTVNGGRGLQSALDASGGTNPTTLKQIGTQIAAYTSALKQARGLSGAAATQFRNEISSNLANLQAAQKTLVAARNKSDFNKAFQYGHDLLGGYNVINQKNGPQAAMKFVVDQALANLKNFGPAGRKELAQGLITWGAEMKKQNPQLSGQVDDLTKGIKKNFTGVGEHIKIVNDKIYTGSKTEWGNIRDALINPMEKAKESVSASFTIIQQKALGTLQAMGYTAAQAKSFVGGIESGNVSAAGIGQTYENKIARGTALGPALPASKKARGGRFAGSGLQDSIMVGGNMVAPGELAVNRHSEARADAILRQHGTSLGSLVAGEALPHSAPRRHARGGRIGATANTSIASLIHGLLPGTSNLGGSAGAMVDATGLMYAGGMAQGIEQVQAKQAAATGAGLSSLGGGTSGANQKLGYKMMLAMGWPASEWPALKALWTGESGWSASAYNKSSGAQGIPQFLPMPGRAIPPGFPGNGPLNAAAQIQWGLNYIRGRADYGSPSRAYSAWESRSPHWYGNGGDFYAKKPQVIGVGDKDERVTITPKGKAGYRATHMVAGGGGGVAIPITIEQINYSAPGDISDVVEKEIRSAIGKVTREIQNIGLAQEEQLVR